MAVRENLVKLCEKINDGQYKITPDCAEYRVFEQWITDEQIALLMAINGTMKVNFLANIAKRAGVEKEKARAMNSLAALFFFPRLCYNRKNHLWEQCDVSFSGKHIGQLRGEAAS